MAGQQEFSGRRTLMACGWSIILKRVVCFATPCPISGQPIPEGGEEDEENSFRDAGGFGSHFRDGSRGREHDNS